MALVARAISTEFTNNIDNFEETQPTQNVEYPISSTWNNYTYWLLNTQLLNKTNSCCGLSLF